MVEDISLVTNEIRAKQAYSTSDFDQRINEQCELIRTFLGNTEETSKALRAQLDRTLKHGSPPTQALDKSTNSSSSSLLQIKASRPKRNAVYCTNQCRCDCHRIHTLQSPSFLNRLLGKLFIGYSGCPAGLVPPCSDASCGSRLSSYTQVIYVFPSWFCTKVLTLLFETSPLGDPSFTLVVYRGVPTGSKSSNSRLATTLMAFDPCSLVIRLRQRTLIINTVIRLFM